MNKQPIKNILNHAKLKLEDMVVFFPAGLISSALKCVRMELMQEDKKFIAQNHLIHCTSNKEKAEQIVQSGQIWPARGFFKNANSYGESAACMFAGIPSIDNFVKNLSASPFKDPTMVINAVEIDIHEDELNNNYKMRKFADEAVLYEGYCVLPEGRAKAVQMVVDLKRDEKRNGHKR